MMRQPRLQISLFDEYGHEKAMVCYNLNPLDEREQTEITPPDRFDPTVDLDECVHKMKARDYREVKFADIGYRLGKLMAQRLADKEGWYGEERKKTEQ